MGDFTLALLSPHHEREKKIRVNPAYIQLNNVTGISENTFNFALPSTSASASSTLSRKRRRSFNISENKLEYPEASNTYRDVWKLLKSRVRHVNTSNTINIIWSQ